MGIRLVSLFMLKENCIATLTWWIIFKHLSASLLNGNSNCILHNQPSGRKI